MLVICCASVALVLTALLVLISLPEKNPSTIEVVSTLPTQTLLTEPPTIATIPEQRIADGVTISGVSVSGMTKEEAIVYLQEEVPNPYTDKKIKILVNEQSLRLSGKDAGIRWNVDKAVNTALGGTEKEIQLELTMDTDQVIRKLQAFLSPLGGIYNPSGYWLEGDPPDLDQMTGSFQTLILNTGSAGYYLDLQDVCDKILASFRNEKSKVNIGSLGDRKEPQVLDVEKIFTQVSTPPVNPRVDPETLQVLPGKLGYGFDRDKAASLLESAKAGDTIRLQMEYLEPASEEDAWFQDILGYCKTEYTDNENRNENIRLACSKLNGLILQPGEILSYNELLGKRTTAAGYKPAPAYIGTELAEDIGGGICQVSSTLYLSSLFAELHIVERKNHGYPASYIPLGLDATVNWGTTDLKIKNNYDLPVKILAEATDGFVKIKIMGVERRDYYVKMEYRVDDHPDYAAAFLCRYDRETDEQIYRVLDHTSIYLEDVWCNPGYAESATDDP